MIRTTPFHERLSALNETGLWEHWSSYLTATRYQSSDKFEYFAIRNAAGLFDTSPLYKYRIHGPDAERFLAGVLARDIRTCLPGHAQYTLWCDDAGFVVEDGVILRHGPNEFVLTAAEPNLGLLRGAHRSARRRDRGDLRRLGGAVGPGPALPRAAGVARPGDGRAAVLRPDDDLAGPRPGPHLADRVHRRPRLRGVGPGVRRPDRVRRDLGRQPGHGDHPDRDDRAVHGPDRGRSRPARRRLPLEPLRLDRCRPDDADRAGSRLDVPRPRDRRPDVHRQRRDPARAARQDVALEADRARRRLARLRPDLRQRRADPAQGPHPDPGRVLHLRRRAEPARLRHEPDVLADAPAPHRPGPRPARSTGARARGSSSSSRSTTATSTSTPASPAHRSTRANDPTCEDQLAAGGPKTPS